MMKQLFLTSVLLLAISAVAKSTDNLDKKGTALSGYDPVSYFKSTKPIKGQEKINAVYEEARYLFSSEENKQAFLKEPQKYLPQFGGWCAYAVAKNKEKVEVDPESFLIQEGRLLLFYNGFLADTRDKWQHTKDKNAAAYLKDADQNWLETKVKEP